MANEDYKNGKLVEIVREFNNTGNQYEVNGIKQAIAVPFWRRENDKFQVIPKGSYSFINEAGNDYLKILDSTILQQATQFQIVYDYLQLSSKYIEDFPDVVVLTEKYNQLVDDTTNLFSYLKSVGLVADTLQMTKVLSALEPLTTWYMDEKGEIRTLPVSDLYGKFQQMIDTLYAEIKNLLIKDKESMSTELKNETSKLLGSLNDLESNLSTNISKLSTEEIKKIIAEGKKQIELVTNAGAGLAPKVDELEKNKLDKGNVSTNYNSAEKMENEIKKIKDNIDSGSIEVPWENILNKPTALPNPYALTISLNGASQGNYNGETAKSIDITASSVGALPIEGGTITSALIVNGKTTTADVQTNGDLIGTSEKSISGFGKVYNPVWG